MKKSQDHGNLEKGDYVDKDGNYDLDTEWKLKWRRMPEQEKNRHLTYLRWMHEFVTNRMDFDTDKAKWLLENCDCDITIIPYHYHKEFNLGEKE